MYRNRQRGPKVRVSVGVGVNLKGGVRGRRRLPLNRVLQERGNGVLLPSQVESADTRRRIGIALGRTAYRVKGLKNLRDQVLLFVWNVWNAPSFSDLCRDVILSQACDAESGEFTTQGNAHTFSRLWNGVNSWKCADGTQHTCVYTPFSKKKSLSLVRPPTLQQLTEYSQVYHPPPANVANMSSNSQYPHGHDKPHWRKVSSTSRPGRL